MSSIDVIVVPSRDDDGLIAPRGAATVEDFRKRAPEVAESIQEVAGIIQAHLDDRPQPSGAWSMDTVSLSFELALEAGAGVVIARASTTATFSIEIGWTRAAAAGSA